MSFIITASGRKFYPLAPTVEQVCLFDIASHLSKMTRWTGATKYEDVYSVAQHAVYVSHLCDSKDALQGLHHDSSEAYLVDVARPLKYTPGFKEVYMKHEAILTSVIFQLFEIPFDGSLPESVVEADDKMLATEARDIMPLPIGGEATWNESGIYFSNAYSFRIDSIWPPKYAREQFIKRHEDLIRRRGM